MNPYIDGAPVPRKNLNEIKEWYILYMQDKSCSNCGTDDPDVLCWHHIKGKTHTISKMVTSGYSVKNILLELKKCVCLCCNCHVKLHKVKYRK